MTRGPVLSAGDDRPARAAARTAWRRSPVVMAAVILAVAGCGLHAAGAAQVQVVDPVVEPVAPPASVPPSAAASATANGADTEPVAANLWSTGVNATGAVLMTPLFPGWGQLYADGGWRAALAFGAEMYFWSNLLSRDRQARRDLEFAATLPVDSQARAYVTTLAAEHHEQVKDFVWWSGGALLIIALDAYVGAHLFNFDHDAVPVPDDWEDVFGPVGSGPPVSAGAGSEVTVFQWRKGF